MIFHLLFGQIIYIFSPVPLRNKKEEKNLMSCIKNTAGSTSTKLFRRKESATMSELLSPITWRLLKCTTTLDYSIGIDMLSPGGPPKNTGSVFGIFVDSDSYSELESGSAHLKIR